MIRSKPGLCGKRASNSAAVSPRTGSSPAYAPSTRTPSAWSDSASPRAARGTATTAASASRAAAARLAPRETATGRRATALRARTGRAADAGSGSRSCTWRRAPGVLHWSYTFCVGWMRVWNSGWPLSASCAADTRKLWSQDLRGEINAINHPQTSGPPGSEKIASHGMIARKPDQISMKPTCGLTSADINDGLLSCSQRGHGESVRASKQARGRF